MTRTSCLPCADGTYANNSQCITCPNGARCPFASDAPFALSSAFLKPTNVTSPLRIGSLADAAVLQSLLVYYGAAGAALIALITIAFVIAFVSPYRTVVIKGLQRADIMFAQLHHVEVGMAVRPRQTAWGGALSMAFIVTGTCVLNCGISIMSNYNHRFTFVCLHRSSRTDGIPCSQGPV